MVRACRGSHTFDVHFPRIRGDGPGSEREGCAQTEFSPYSRGWSRVHLLHGRDRDIFPVFAGMVPLAR